MQQLLPYCDEKSDHVRGKKIEKFLYEEVVMLYIYLIIIIYIVLYL